MARHVAIVARFRPGGCHDGRHVRHRYGVMGPERQGTRSLRVPIDGGTLPRLDPLLRNRDVLQGHARGGLDQHAGFRGRGASRRWLRGDEDQGRQEPGVRHSADWRDARALPETMLMADANHAYDLPEALRIGRVLDEHGFAWFEEPLSPEYEHQFRQLHDKLDVPLAAGECEQTRFGFQRLLSSGGVQIAQPDLAYCGGISEALKIRAIASSLGVNLIPHCWGTMLNLAAATHFLASGYREPGRAEDGGSILELDRTPNPLRDELFEIPVDIDRATVHVPATPGLGVVVDRAALESFQVKETEIR